ncbi:MAG: TRL-like family protein [Spirochaetaceae bacterium]|nr:TRL-like family protein [Spirochaetaceae bacterium]
MKRSIHSILRYGSLLSVLTGVLLLAGACGTYQPPYGYIYHNTRMNKDVSEATNIGSRSGASCVQSYLGMISFGDASIKAAAATGGIQTVKAVDYSELAVLTFFYNRFCTIAHGD